MTDRPRSTSRGIRILENIAYVAAGGAGHHERHTGDLYLPAGADGAPCALVIHGGGWNAMDRHSFAGVAEFLAEQGWAAFAVNYRLLSHAPWPACQEDCLRAASFVLAAGHPAFRALDRSRLLVCGGSAGGHLALMTGLTLGAPSVVGIVSIAGPTELAGHFAAKPDRFSASRFFGTENLTTDLLRAASPLHQVGPTSPPLLCTHSVVDTLVDLGQARSLVAAYATHGRHAELYTYVGADPNHGIWPPQEALPVDGPATRQEGPLKRLIPILEERIALFLATIRAGFR